MFRPTLPEKENGTYVVLPKAGAAPQVGAKPSQRYGRHYQPCL